MHFIAVVPTGWPHFGHSPDPPPVPFPTTVFTQTADWFYTPRLNFPLHVILNKYLVQRPQGHISTGV